MDRQVTGRSIRVFLNGRARDDARVGEAIHALVEAGHDVEAHAIEGADHAEELAADAAAEGVDTVVAAGGDGTVNDLVNGLLRADARDTALGVLPFGTANDFARSCGIPLDDPVAALALVIEPPIRVDVGRCNDRYFINAVTLGGTVEQTNETDSKLKKAVGGAAYALKTLAHLRDMEPCRLELKGEPDLAFGGNTLLVTVANGRTAGGGFPIAPAATLDDGELDVLLIPDATMVQWPAVAAEVIALEKPGVYERCEYRRVRRVELGCARQMSASLDGDPIEADRFLIEVVPRAVAVHLPLDCELVSR